MLSGLSLGCVLRGADKDQRATNEDVCVAGGCSSPVLTLIGTSTKHSHIKHEGKSFMSCKGFNFTYGTVLMQFNLTLFRLSCWGCFLIQFKLLERGRRNKQHLNQKATLIFSIRKSVDNKNPSSNSNLLSHWFRKPSSNKIKLLRLLENGLMG